MKIVHRLLMTGAGGNIGVQIREKLLAHCDILRLSDITLLEKLNQSEEIMQVDLCDKAAVDTMVEGCDAILHLGGVSIERPFDEVLGPNIVGLHYLYEAARKHGVKRILFASSNHVTGYYKQSETIDALAPPRPDSYYGLSKAYAEDLSRLYYDKYGIETVCMRIGSCFPAPRGRRNLTSYLSYNDMYRLVVACLEAPTVAHTIIFATSNNKMSWWDNRYARHIGFEPQDSADDVREKILNETPAVDLNDKAMIYQGGDFVKLDLS